MQRERVAAAAGVALALLATALVYAPGFAGFWLGDDFGNLRSAWEGASRGETLRGLLALLTRSVSEGAAFFRPAIIASFAFDFTHAGTTYAGWFAHNLLLHLANMGLLGWLLQRLAAQAGLRAGLAMPVAVALFGLSPLLAEGVYWVSARSDASVTLFALLGLVHWVGRPGVPARVAWLPLLMLPALLFKESAVLLPLQAGLLWLALPAMRERRRGIALLAAFALGAGFLAWRAHLFGDALQVYGGSFESGPLQRLVAALASLPDWLRGLAGGDAGWMLGHVGLLALALGLALSAARPRWLLLALAAAAAGGLLATFLNLGALLGSGEGGRLFYTPLAFLALAFGVGCAQGQVDATGRRRAGALAAGVAALAVGFVALLPLLQGVWSTQAMLRQLATALPAAARADAAMLLLVPDHVGPAVALRNGQAALVLPPLQAEALYRQLLPTLPGEVALRHRQYADGLLDRLDAAHAQPGGIEVGLPQVADARGRWPARVGCWSVAAGGLVEFAAPAAATADAWSAAILAEARERGCLLE